MDLRLLTCQKKGIELTTQVETIKKGERLAHVIYQTRYIINHYYFLLPAVCKAEDVVFRLLGWT